MRLNPTILLLPAAVAAASSGCLRFAGPNVGASRTFAPSRRVDRPAAPMPPAPCPVRFVDVAQAAGLHYRWSPAGKRPLNILGTIGNGCALLDYDNSGNLSILLVGSRTALYKGDGHGHFKDVTHEAGLDRLHGHFLGCAVGDYDNDGYDDIYLSGYHTGILLHNEKGKSFTDVTRNMGLAPQPWGTSAILADFDGDGYLDLFVADYVQFGPKDRQQCLQNGIPMSCGPHYYKPLHGVLYHNIGGKRFEDVTRSWELTHSGNGLGVAACDFDGTGHTSLAIANDEVMSDLFHTTEGRRMENIAIKAGVYADKYGNMHAGMGIDWGDYDNDGLPDLFVTTYQNEAKCLYHNEGGGFFTERSAETGVRSSLLSYLSFGCKFLDADNDGWQDLLVASGHVADNIALIDSHSSYRQKIVFLHNRGGISPGFNDASAISGVAALPPIVGRGLAVGDFDNDGRVDALIVDSEGAPVLLHNETPLRNHWIGLRLTGVGKSNRDAYGAVVTVRLENGQIRSCQCSPGGSYLSSSDKRVHIGLGRQKADSIAVRWPDGHIQTWMHPPVDRYLEWTEYSSGSIR